MEETVPYELNSIKLLYIGFEMQPLAYSPQLLGHVLRIARLRAIEDQHGPLRAGHGKKKPGSRRGICGNVIDAGASRAISRELFSQVAGLLSRGWVMDGCECF